MLFHEQRKIEMKDRVKHAYKSSQTVYDEVLTGKSPLWKLYNRIFWNMDDREVALRLLDSIPENFSGTLLDVPVGTGVFTEGKYARLSAAEITCVDYSADMLTQAETRFTSAGLAHVRCLGGDVGQLGFADESFDIVLSMNGFHAFPDKPRAFSETSRVLKQGGLFLGCFYIRKERFLTDLLVSRVLSPRGWFAPPFYTLEELKHKLECIYSSVQPSSSGGAC
jgi:ubiquinone/menaquinone biosynthesis C-methylase UbiE